MIRIALLAVAAALMAAPALAADEPHQALLEHMAPFDKAAEDGWEALAPVPIYASVAVGTPEGAPLTLQPGAYRVVVLCDCGMMDVTLLRPDNSPVAPERSDDHGAMFSFDVPTAGAYLTGLDMQDCSQPKCEVGLKVYRKKPS